MARIDVPMPQMGESIAEGTVSKWLKQVGQEVARDEPLLEISTDKVDAEIPSPSAGTLVEVAVQEGQTVEVGTVLGFIETEASAAAAARPSEPAAGSAGGAPPASAAEPAAASSQTASAAAPPATPAPQAQAPQPAGAAPAAARSGGAGGDGTAEERLRQRSTPLVRRIAQEHGVDLSAVAGSGHAGRVTKQDILAYIESGGKAEQAAAAPTRPVEREAVGGAFSADALWDVFYGQVRHPEFPARAGDRVEPMNRIRRLTADHMVRAKRIAPHVHSFIEIDFTQIDRVRNGSRAKWEQQGVRVSYTAFVAWAVARVLPEFPTVNSTISGENIIYRGSVNIGIAVDLDPGLIVPVVRAADELNLIGIARRINDLAQRARDRKLNPDEIQGATFSITNPGVLGTVVGMPIIPEGTAAILGTGVIEKKAVVLEADGADVIAVRKRSLFSLGYDHRIVDGADAARFLARLKAVLDAFPDDA